jgi:hypothetical protein
MLRTPRHRAAGLAGAFLAFGWNTSGPPGNEYRRSDLGSRDPTNPIQGVLVMRSKLLLGVAAPALAALTLAATSAPASAQWPGWGWGWGGAAVAAGVISWEDRFWRA